MALAIARTPIANSSYRSKLISQSLLQLKQNLLNHDGYILKKFYCSGSPKLPNSTDKQNKLTKYSPENVKQNVKGYVFTRFFDHVKNYDKLLEKNFPQAVQVYRIFFDGVKFFLTDMKKYIKITRIVNNEGIQALTRNELELYLRMPRDMIKVAPALLFSAVPFVGYAVFPIAFMYPRKFLTSHFWSIQQKADFQNLLLKERFSYNRKVFRHLQAKLKSLKKHALYPKLKHVLGLLGSGQHPSADEIIELKDLFSKSPYSLDSLSSTHIVHLSQIHGISGGIFKRNQLREHGFIIHYMDLAIKREGNIHNMPTEALRYSCQLRGLNPSNLSNENLIEWLRIWSKVSLELEEQHISLLLHLPVLICYNHPNNWKLIYGETK